MIPTTRRGQQTRAALVDAAAEVFGEKQFLATNVTDIATRAGTAHGTFYRYFDSKEAIFREVALDLEEGADMVMVKPAMSYLDIVRDVADMADVPVSAYQISGEYAMIEAAAANGWIDRRASIVESVLSIRRAGADSVLTYWAAELGRWMKEGSL